MTQGSHKKKLQNFGQLVAEQLYNQIKKENKIKQNRTKKLVFAPRPSARFVFI